MDEKHLQGYQHLIEKLLNCSYGQEAEILQSNAELIDQELLQVMRWHAKQFQAQGQTSAAKWLQCLADQLLKTLGLPACKGELIKSCSESLQFLSEALQCIVDNRGNRETFFHFLTSHQSKITADLQEVLPTAFAQFEKRFSSVEQQLIAQQVSASLAMVFGNLIGAYPLGNHSLNVELAIAAYYLALQFYTYETYPVDWARTQNNLALAYRNRIEGNRAKNLEQAIQAYQLALQVLNHETFPVEWALTQNNIGVAYQERIEGNRAENLEQAIQAFQLALKVRTCENYPLDWAMTQNNLAIAYIERIQDDRADNLERAIQACQLALQVRTCENFPLDWAQTHHNLAIAYLERIHGDRADNLERAIQACQLALQVRTAQTCPLDWAATQNNLASAYRERIRGDRADNLERAIQAYELALQVRTRENLPIAWAETQNNLASAYRERIRGDRADNLERAIQAYEPALQVRTRENLPIAWAETQSNLAIAYIERIHGDRADNLERAIQTVQLALQVQTQKDLPIAWAETQHNLADAYNKRIYGDRADNFKQAIQAYELALQVRTRENLPIKWAMTQNNLAATYAESNYGDRGENLEKAIEAYQQVLKFYTRENFPVQWATVQNNLGLAYRDRVRGEPSENFDRAITAFRLCLEIFHPDQMPNDCRRTAKLLGNLFADGKRYSESIQPYELALQATEQLYRSSLFRSSQEAELAETGDLYRRAAYAFAHASDLQAAVVAIERGRARGLSESLERDRANLNQVKQSAPAVFANYQQVVVNLRQLEMQERAMNSTSSRPQLSLDTLRQRASQLHEGLNTAIAAIRAIPGYEDFLSEPDFTDIAAAVHPDQPLVYLVTTAAGSLALIVYSSDKPEHPEIVVDSIWSNSLTDETLLTLLVGPADIPEQGGWFGAYNHRRSNQDTWFQTLVQVTQQLWDSLMESVLTHLTDLGVRKAVLIPTGFLGLLPLHAAWTADPSTPTGRRYALDVITFTYAPNARSLVAAREIRDRTVPTLLLAIDNPQPTQCTYLSNSEQEVQAAISHFPNHKVLPKEQATRDAVLAALSKYPVLHFSCHGYANLASPLDSGLLMSNDQLLTLRDFFSLDFLNLQDKSQGIRIAILSACETGLPGMELPDEVINLPTGLLQAGVGGIVSSLWSVADLSTMIMLTRFYDLWRNDKLEPATALRQAQLWVRDTTSQQKAKYFQETNPDLFQSLILRAPHYFAHPFHWAAFTYVGV